MEKIIMTLGGSLMFKVIAKWVLKRVDFSVINTNDIIYINITLKEEVIFHREFDLIKD